MKLRGGRGGTKTAGVCHCDRLPLATPAIAADQLALPALPPLATKVPPSLLVAPPTPSAQMEFALRFWYGNAKTSKSLFAPPSISGQMVSRLTYSGLQTYSGELYGRVASWNGWYVKGYVGGGDIKGGHLQDEDFPPIGLGFISATTSRARTATSTVAPWSMPVAIWDTTWCAAAVTASAFLPAITTSTSK
jgi:hypothetical protein